MGRHYKYRPGSFYRVDDRTGFPQRAENTLKEWTGEIVDRDRYEERQPQDLVRGTKDDQTVPDPRPPAPDTYVGPVATLLATAMTPGGSHVFATDPLWLQVGAQVGVVLDNGAVLRAAVAFVAADGSFYLDAILPAPAAAGNVVISYGQIGAAAGRYLTDDTGQPIVTVNDQLIFV